MALQRSTGQLIGRAALWLVPAAVLTVLLVAPLIRLCLQGWGVLGFGDAALYNPADESSFWQLWQDPHLRWRLAWSIAQAAASCAMTVVLGVPIAWVLARLDFAGRGWVLRLLMLPFVVPTLVAAMGILALWGPHGLISATLGFNLQGTPWLLLLGNVFFNLCVVVRAAVDGLQHVPAQQVAAARSLGATAWRAFWRVEWPALRPWLAASVCLVFLYCLAGFGMALVLGGQRYATVEVEIYTLVAHELKLSQASSLSVWMLLITGAVALAYALIERALSQPNGTSPIPRKPPTAWQWLAVAGAIGCLLVLCLAPLAVLLWRALMAGSAAWSSLLSDDSQLALYNTLRFTALSLVLATLLGLAHAFSARSSVLWRAATFLPFVVSPITVGFGLLLLYPSWTASLPLLIAAYAVLAYPFVSQSISTGLDSQPPHLAQAARSLGAKPWRTFWRVTLPLLRPALQRGMAFAAATAVGEFAVSLFLSRPEWLTLSTLIYQYLGRPGARNMDAAMVHATVLMLLALGLFCLIEWRARAPWQTQPHSKVTHA